VLLIASVGSNYNIFDRYALGLLVVVLACLVRLYQEQVRPQLPLAAIALVAVMALYGIIVTHNLFSFYRARTVLADELYSNGVHDTSFDGGWESNIAIELRHADHINSPRIALPADAYVPTPPLPHGSCPMHWYDYTPHIHPLYTVSLGPNACYGAAPFAPVHYSHWPYRTPGTLYVVRSTPATRQ
jgi:hypothetical protein